ncbi:NAD(P)-dependent oxidoreductase [Mesorhizobium sp. B2-4-19]|uniref:NAD(P)-dependent oxidoreductase n=1 Tax=Mesorhizobium sp. B2-4-19 TaxID=2589930 RepID=UPI0011291BFF|nr:NAD(P)-dependent oxidoreductase [Mesorhizobium sp. B2-4-19]TPK59119.1 NAD(P)-dependent oxidoreductase [Mesorhizobium sp. B2-4-19]
MASDTLRPPAHVAFLGLGKMGVPMANAIAKAGFRVRSWTRSQRRPDALAEAVEFLPSPLAAVNDAAAVVAMLADGNATDAALFGSGVADRLSPGTIIVDMGTSGPEVASVHSQRFAMQGCAYLDAPVSGGVAGAMNASLTIFAGGEFRDFERVKSILDTMGTPHHLGPVGAGQTAKLANQIIVAVSIAALAEGLTFAEGHGLDAVRLIEALKGGFADSAVLRQHGPRMAARDFSAAGAMRLHLKDLRLAKGGNSETFCHLWHANKALDVFEALVAQGLGDTDHSGYVVAYGAPGPCPSSS